MGTITYSVGSQALEEVHSETVGSPSLEVLKTQQDKDLSNLI